MIGGQVTLCLRSFCTGEARLSAFVRIKNLMTGLFIAFGILVISYCALAKPTEFLPDDCGVAVTWNIIHNVAEGSKNSFASELVIKNTGNRALESSGWQLYFNFCRKILPESVDEAVRIVHVNGDLFRLEPNSDFTPLRPGMSRTIRFKTDFWVIKESDSPSGCYLVVKDDLGLGETIVPIDHVKVGPIVTRKQTMRAQNDRVELPSPGSRYYSNLALDPEIERDCDCIVPSPVMFKVQPETVELNRDYIILAPEQLDSEAKYLADSLGILLGDSPRITSENPEHSEIISLSISDCLVGGDVKSSGDNAYRLSVKTDGGISIVGTDPTGVFYGIQSLRALLPIDAYRNLNNEISIQVAEFEDSPRFLYRGLHLDVARNFQGSSSVKKMLELMAFYKLNKFHFHLTDDEGWRLEIKGLPELTEVGGRRAHSDSEGIESSLPPSFGSGPIAEADSSYGSGFYSRQEFIDILRYAAERHIEVIPEIDLPGHARAAIRAMDVRYQRLLNEGLEEEARKFLLRNPGDLSKYESVQMWKDNVIDICQESSYAFVRHVIADVKSMYEEAGIELSTVHLGGDEVPQGVWQQSSACQQLSGAADSSQSLERKEAMSRFFENISQRLATEGITTAAWEEVFLSDGEKVRTGQDISRNLFKSPSFRCHVWNSVWGWGREDVAYRLANAGVNVVLCNATHLYFDLAYDKDPREPGYYWAGFVDTRTPYSFAPLNYLANVQSDLMGHEISQDLISQRITLTEQGEKHILGIQGQLWGENLKGEASLEYMALPRLIALAERAWARQPEWAEDTDPESRISGFQEAWSGFACGLGSRELPRLDFLGGGFSYRIPCAGAMIEEGVLKANVAFPGLTIRYTTDGSEPNANSQLYEEPVHVGPTAAVRVFNSIGRGGRSCVVDDPITREGQ